MRDAHLMVAGLLAALAAGAGLALHRWAPRNSAPRTGARTFSVAAAWRYPPGATEEERLALVEHLHQGTPLPAGCAPLDDLGESELRLTGRVNPATGEREIEARVTDELADLEQARLYVNGQLLATATRANGAIVDDPAGGSSSAALSAWIPAGPRWSAAVEWDVDPGGPTQRSTLSVRESWLPGWLARIFRG